MADLDALDFWLGGWNVALRDGTPAGTNLLERALSGYAVFEHWRGADGGEGESFFYFDPANRTWRQVWVMAGCAKEKQLVAGGADELVFAGTAFVAGRSFLDRTTLAPAPDGTVTQRIEQSLDGGRTWQTSFDAVYSRA
jgi:hypothetical protein